MIFAVTLHVQVSVYFCDSHLHQDALGLRPRGAFDCHRIRMCGKRVLLFFSARVMVLDHRRFITGLA
jgi:hypothetical protein